ncbi:6759_t:CDS:2 [Racocetra fulgida]|uniref:6759_t:CDS:1 n=1 Tax=Racocetra fulgida TaxID=60492 RepID=A0A9N8Z9K0_9GLOM|nr:6759_t:CDS:2 [Racocetra fulgida]
MPRAVFHSAVAGGINNSKIVVYGGTVNDPASAAMTSLLIYDPSTSLWNPLTIPSTPPRRHDHSAAILPNNNMLIFGGEINPSTDILTSVDVGELWGFNTISLSEWQGFPYLANSPGIRDRHTASVIGNKMIILGGVDEKSLFVSMSNVYVFDSETVNWSFFNATGQVPSPRINTTIFGDVAVLDTKYWNWVAPATINPPTGRTGSAQRPDNRIYCLNLVNWTWVDRYVPQPFPANPLVPPPPSTLTPYPTSTTSNSPIVQVISISKELAIGLLIKTNLFRLNDSNDGDGSNHSDSDEQSAQPQNSIFANRLLGNTSDNDIRPSDPENGRRRSVKFSENNVTIPVVYTKGHHPQGSVEVELGNTDDINGSESSLDVQMQPHDGASVVSRNELRVVNPDPNNQDLTDQEDN